MNSLLAYVLEYIGEATTLSVLFCGAYSLVRGAPKMQAALVLGTGVILGFAAIAHEVQTASVRAKAAAVVHMPLKLQELPPGWGQNLTPEHRADSIFLARAFFAEQGRLVQYMKGDGVLITFAPTEEDIRRRDEVMVAKARFDAINAMSPPYPIRWLVLMLTALVLGLILGRSGLANRTLPGDAGWYR